MTSPAFTPALSAGPPGVTVVTSAPGGALGSVGSDVSTPRYGRAILSPFSSRGTTSRTVFDGTAKPMPTLPCELPAVAICELTPMTRAVSSSSGPPELPGLIGASVWMTWSIEKPLGALIERPMPETMPSVAVRSRPNGLPMAIAVSPTWTWRESANCSGLALRGALPGSILTTARSLDGSAPLTWPSMLRPSGPNLTTTRSALPTTCALVTSVPLRSMRKPVPEPTSVRIETTAGLAWA